MLFGRVIKVLLIVIVAFAFASIVTAFAASNTFTGAAPNAGEGSTGISGYQVSAVHYTLNGTTPSNIDAVTFTLDAAATTVKIKLVSTGSTYYSCTNTSGNNWSCDTTAGTQATVSPANQLTVIATQ